LGSTTCRRHTNRSRSRFLNSISFFFPFDEFRHINFLLFLFFQQTLARWRIAFLLSAGILTANAIIFIVLGSTERQDWDRATVGKEETVGHVGEAPSSSKHQLLKSVTLSTA
jgi:hypothetical protein